MISQIFNILQDKRYTGTCPLLILVDIKTVHHDILLRPGDACVFQGTVFIGSSNGLVPKRCQATSRNNADLLPIKLLKTHSSEIILKSQGYILENVASDDWALATLLTPVSDVSLYPFSGAAASGHQQCSSSMGGHARVTHDANYPHCQQLHAWTGSQSRQQRAQRLWRQWQRGHRILTLQVGRLMSPMGGVVLALVAMYQWASAKEMTLIISMELQSSATITRATITRMPV